MNRANAVLIALILIFLAIVAGFAQQVKDIANSFAARNAAIDRISSGQ
jgi:outer membrane lipoprotein-sorting protein